MANKQRSTYKRNIDWYKRYMKKHKCEHCGISDYRVLCWHHVEKKHKEIGRMVVGQYSIKAILKEMNKCICLCYNCHRIVHYES